ncbi:hypothetical protein E0E52_14525 [Azotobacter chroococcum]|uniref:hypothetical protein n=1 Tax=Azotobacter chroococcum TaxID=353 RepID=UPI00103BDBDA|nr:hypothetical protein [Azotobacter chroococcum]TBW03702.1 hypothetical protein E0E52_14525 [Azotobacter chroococcum]
MLVKLHDVDDSLVAKVKALTGQATASKAFQFAAVDALQMVDEIRDLRRQVDDLRTTVEVQRQTLEAARSSASKLLEVVAQEDIFYAR